ncbi:MAG: lytic transglycosylase domain-containing protein [Myxococcales bacterium]
MISRRSLRRSLKRARIRVARHAVLVGILGLFGIAALNWGVRSAGGSVSLLSMSRLGPKAEALSTLALHGLRCDGHDQTSIEAAIRSAARRHQVSEGLALALARVESSLVHTRISSTGAMGLMQLMPNTARELGVQDPFDVAQNADAGVRYLKQLLGSYRGDVKRALAAYNAGSARVPRKGPLNGLPLETRTYVFRIVGGI